MRYENKIGIIQNLDGLLGDEGDRLIGTLCEIGIESLQVLVNESSFELLTSENARKLLGLLHGRLEVTSLWGGWHSGPSVWSFTDGPTTLGIVPRAYTAERLGHLKLDVDFAQMLGVKEVMTHVGFIPERPISEEYRSVVGAVREIADYAARYGICFNFETGQETPITLMRTISDVGRENLGVNLDPANLLMYGKGNPTDAIGIFGSRIHGVHVKDGRYPEGDYYRLGRECVVGEGQVNFPVFLPKLLESGYKGDLYIEHEIGTRDRLDDVRRVVGYLREILA